MTQGAVAYIHEQWIPAHNPPDRHSPGSPPQRAELLGVWLDAHSGHQGGRFDGVPHPRKVRGSWPGVIQVDRVERATVQEGVPAHPIRSGVGTDAPRRPEGEKGAQNLIRPPGTGRLSPGSPWRSPACESPTRELTCLGRPRHVSRGRPRQAEVEISARRYVSVDDRQGPVSSAFHIRLGGFGSRA